jgi:hypothetical protein
MSTANKKVRGIKLLKLLQEELDKLTGETIRDEKVDVNEEAARKLRKEVVARVYREASSENRSPLRAKGRRIVLSYEVLPFSAVTRSPELENGLPWRCDGEPVTFSLQQTHDELQVYSTRGEFISSFPVAHDGEVTVRDLPPGIYILYLNGRRIASMNFAK